MSVLFNMLSRFVIAFPQGNRLSCRDQEGRRGSEEAVPGPSVFPSGEPGVSGAFGGRRKAVRDRFAMIITRG